IYLFLLAIYPVLFLYAFNIQEVTLDMLWLPLAVTTSIAGLLIISSKAILRTWSRAALWSAVSLVVIFTFGRVLPLLPDMLVKFGEFVLGKNSLAMLFAIL